MDATAFTVSLWLCTTASSADIPALVSDKDWDTGNLTDVTSNHDLGMTRSSGSDKGWVVALGADGGWVWNVGDGESRLDFRPPPVGAGIADGVWHMLAFSIDPAAAEARLYRDGVNVAVYSLAGLKDVRSGAEPIVSTTVGAKDLQIDVQIEAFAETAEQIRSRWSLRTGKSIGEALAEQPVDHLRVMAWNIWHGGRRDGDEAGLQATIEVIRSSGADVVAMQETYGSGAHIAAGLGFYYYLRSSNLSIMSRYPIRATHDLYEPFRLGGVTLELSPGQHLKLFSLWIHYLPDYGGRMKDSTTPVTVDQLLEEEMQTRGREIDEILSLLQHFVSDSDGTPLVVAGDFNSPSHLDWEHNTASLHRGLVVPWPVSRAMAKAGFVDAFRSIHTDVVDEPGYTWSPRFSQAWKDRIDYVYLHGSALEPRAAKVRGYQEPQWPSDHAAVVVDISID